MNYVATPEMPANMKRSSEINEAYYGARMDIAEFCGIER